MMWDLVHNYGQYIIFVAAIIVAVTTICTGFIKPVVIRVREAKEILFKLTAIATELQPNGGATLRDAINRIESRQIKEQQLLHSILFDSDRGIFECDKDGQCIWANPRMISLSGTSVLGMDWINSVATETRAIVRAEWFSSILDARTFFSILVFDHQGLVSPIKVSCRIRPLKMGDNTVIGWLGTCVPVNIESSLTTEVLP